jgi:DivIVA domain-containing protein
MGARYRAGVTIRVLFRRYGVGMLTASAIRSVTIPRVKFREGYDIDEVDALVESVAAPLDHWERYGSYTGPLADDIAHVRFQPTTFREGYDQDFVDDLLDGLVATVSRIGES